MSLPRGEEYLEAIQNPRFAFSDISLKQCDFEKNQFGLPTPYSGAFTATFHLFSSQPNNWAVRCFTRTVPDLVQRYKAIGAIIQKAQKPFFVMATCLEDGIRIGSHWHPVIKMEWVEGEKISLFIERHKSDPNVIHAILRDFESLVHDLEILGIAHGDLQHGNIIVSNNRLVLIDYDGMYLPQLSSLSANEIGHPNYQHPDREEKHYGPDIDRFSSIVIYTALRALTESSKLWTKYDNSENLLFCEEDFLHPESSPLLADIASIVSLNAIVDRFRGICKLPIENIPNLSDFKSGNFNYLKISPVRTKAKPKPQVAVRTKSTIPVRVGVTPASSASVHHSFKHTQPPSSVRSHFPRSQSIVYRPKPSLQTYLQPIPRRIKTGLGVAAASIILIFLGNSIFSNNGSDRIRGKKANRATISSPIARVYADVGLDSQIRGSLSKGTRVQIVRESIFNTDNDKARVDRNTRISVGGKQINLQNGTNVSILGTKGEYYIIAFMHKKEEVLSEINRRYVQILPQKRWVYIKSKGGIEGWIESENI